MISERFILFYFMTQHPQFFCINSSKQILIAEQEIIFVAIVNLNHCLKSTEVQYTDKCIHRRRRYIIYYKVFHRALYLSLKCIYLRMDMQTNRKITEKRNAAMSPSLPEFEPMHSTISNLCRFEILFVQQSFSHQVH